MKKLIPHMLGRYLNVMSVVWPGLAAHHGFKIFCHPFRVPMKSYQQAFLNTAEKFTVDYKNIAIQGYRWGQGEKKVLMLHGWQSHTFRWKRYIEAMVAAGYTVYAIDAPGHGNSAGRMLHVPMYSEVVRQVMAAHGTWHAVVSHSMGSFAILYALYKDPFLPVNKLVLLAPPGEAVDFITFFSGILKLSKRALQLMVDRFSDRIEKPISFFATDRFAAALTMPGLIIHDIEDDETPYSASVKIHHAWKQSRLISTQGLKHNLKSPQIVAEVKGFVTDDPVDQAPSNQSHYIS